MHMDLVFTTRFEMFPVFIVTRQEVLTLVALLSYQHFKMLSDTSGLAIDGNNNRYRERFAKKIL